MYLLIVTSPENDMQAGGVILHYYIIPLATVPKNVFDHRTGILLQIVA